MRNTHTLTHKPSHLFAYSLLVSLFTLAVGAWLPGQVGISYSSARKCTAISVDALLSSHCNQPYLTFTEILTAGNPGWQHAGLGKAGDHQPLSVQQRLFAKRHLNSQAVRLDGAVIYFRPLLSHRLGRAKRGKTGQLTLSSSSHAKKSDSDTEDGEHLATQSQFPNPQSVLSQCVLNGTRNSSVCDLVAAAFSNDSQVFTVVDA